jgi:hypothetical protein
MPSIVTVLRRAGTAVLALSIGAAASTMGCDKMPLLAPNSSTITLSTSSSIVQANGTAEIRATVLESSGTPVQNGTTVIFSTTLGTLSPAEARTNNGTATVQFVPNGASGQAEIRATSGAAKVEESLVLRVGAAAAGRIAVVANPARLPATGGNSQITATVADTSGNPLGSVPVSFTTSAGSLSTSSTTTNMSGQATVTLTTNREATVTATSGGSSGSGTAVAAVTGTVTVTLGAVPTITIGSPTPTTPAEGLPVSFPLTIAAGTGGTTADRFSNVVVDWGDGSSTQLGPVYSNTSIAHTYNRSGSFTVSVNGTTVSGDTSSASTVVFISARAPLSVTVSPLTGSRTASTLYNVTVTPPTGVEGVDWNFGDGTPAQHTTGTSTSHVFPAAGTFNLTVTVDSTDGNSGTGVFQILVP